MTIHLNILKDKKKTADLLILGVFANDKQHRDAKNIHISLSTLLEDAAKAGRFDGKRGKTLFSYGNQITGAAEVMAVGLGEKKNYSAKHVKAAVGRALQSARANGAKEVQIYLPSFVGGKLTDAEVAGLIAESKIRALYRFDQYKKKKEDSAKEKKINVELLVLNKNGLAQIKKSIEVHESMAQGTVFARNLVNEPGNVMHPQQLALEAKTMAEKNKMSCQILGLSEIKKLKMGGVLAVSQGSSTPPAFIVLEYGKKFKGKGTICLVGKGVTFDTGGLSIKPSKGMEKMKYDMAGAAVVLGAMKTIALLKLPIHVVSLTPAVENNVSEDPQRPGDIIRMFNEKTVEVLNTDAEGRLILADALSYAEKFKPRMIVDLATLTGMAAYTFGDQCCAVLGSDEKLVSKLKKAGTESTERCWELPLYEEYGAQIKGQHSDLINIGGPHGGTITAAMFLKEFVPPKTPWAHLDIAGVSWCDRTCFDGPVGASGFGVKLLAKFLAALK